MQADEITVLDGVIVARVQSTDFDEDKSCSLLQQLLAQIEATPTAPVVLNLSKTTVMPSMSSAANGKWYCKIAISSSRLGKPSVSVGCNRLRM